MRTAHWRTTKETTNREEKRSVAFLPPIIYCPLPLVPFFSPFFSSPLSPLYLCVFFLSKHTSLPPSLPPSLPLSLSIISCTLSATLSLLLSSLVLFSSLLSSLLFSSPLFFSPLLFSNNFPHSATTAALSSLNACSLLMPTSPALCFLRLMSTYAAWRMV